MSSRSLISAFSLINNIFNVFVVDKQTLSADKSFGKLMQSSYFHLLITDKLTFQRSNTFIQYVCKMIIQLIFFPRHSQCLQDKWYNL